MITDKIKYHDNKNGPQYGADHTLTDNWNPDADYGNSEYVCVFFRVDTKGYDFPSFSFSDADRDAFEKDIVRVFTALGFQCKNEAHNGTCATWTKGKAHLYLHPQAFSGEVLKADVKVIAEALKDNAAFRLRWVDLYHTVYDITDDEYEEYLTGKDAEIRTAVLACSKTTRTNKYFSVYDIARKLANKVRLQRIAVNDGSGGFPAGQTERHIISVIEQLITEGYLVSVIEDKHDNSDIRWALIRTINKTEQKQRKLFVA